METVHLVNLYSLSTSVHSQLKGSFSFLSDYWMTNLGLMTAPSKIIEATGDRQAGGPTGSIYRERSLNIYGPPARRSPVVEA